MNKKFLNGLLVAALLGGTATAFVSCKDNDADVRTELQGQISSKFGEVTKSLEDAKADLQRQIDDLKAQVAACETNCGAKFAELTDRITTLENKIATLDSIISRIEALESFNADTWFEGKKQQLLVDLLKDVENFLDEHNYVTGDDVNQLIADYIKENLKGILSEEQINQLIADYLKNGNYVTEEELTAKLEGYLTEEDLKTALNTFLESQELKVKIQSIIEEYGYLKSEDLANELKNLGVLTESNWNDFYNSTVKAQIEQLLNEKGGVTQESLDAQLEELTKTIEELVDAKVDALETEMRSLLRDILTSMITGIEINATENPIFGSAALPVDVRTTLLGAYYGKTAETIQFPSVELIGKAGVNMVPEGWDAGELLLDDAEGNAGTLYLTINPNTVDFENQLVTLVTSQGNESPIKLAAVKGSEKELSFGYTRATNANGFYEAAATLSGADIESVKVNIDLDNMKDAAQAALNQRSKSSVVKLAATLLNEASNVLNIPAYAVKASWTENVDGEETATEHSVVSQYAIAATAVKPLSYDFMKDVHFGIPGIERIENLVGSMVDQMFAKVKGLLPDLSGFSNVNFGNIQIELSDATKNALHLEIPVEFDIIIGGGEDPDNYIKDIVVEGQEVIIYEEGYEGDPDHILGVGHIADVVISSADIEGKVHVSYVAKYDMNDVFASIIEDINGSLNLDELQKALDNLSSLSDLGSGIDDMRDNLKNGIFGYIDRLNSIFSNLVGSVNTALQPCLLFTDVNGGIHRVTTSKIGTPVTGTSITLAPTSYTAELFAPAFKKFIAVTDITGNTTKTVAELNAANEDFGKVLSGNNAKAITLEGLEKGCTYEITYSALDYSGNTCTKTFYLSVK